MSIRTPLGSTDRPADRRRSFDRMMHGWRGALVSALLVLVVAGCSTGSARDERRFQAQEAERTQQVPQAQQTELARTFFQPTGTPVATMTPNARLSDLVITSGLDASGGPVDDRQSVPIGSTVILAARLTDLTGGETITFEWMNEDGVVLAASEATAQPSGGPQWYSGSWNAGGVGAGIYAGAVRVQGQLLDSIVFRIG